MTYSVAKCFARQKTIESDLETLLNSLSIETLHSITVSRMGIDYFLALIIYTPSA